MIIENAHITIDSTRAADFELAVSRCTPLFKAARGCCGMTLERQIEDPTCYVLRVEWNSVDDHMVLFRASEAFKEWRALVGPFFAAPPIVVHSSEVGSYF